MQECAYSSGSRKRAGNGGFTLVEIMIASAITVLSILGIYSSMIMFHTLIIAARCHEEAETMAMDRIWSVFNMNYEDLKNYDPNPTVEEVPTTSVLYPLGGTLRTAVLNQTNSCEIMVAVDWQEMTFGRNMRPAGEVLSMRRANTKR